MDAQLIEGLASTVEPDARRMVRERIIEEERRTAERASPRYVELLSEDIEEYAAIQLSEMHLAKPDRAHYRAWLNTTNFSISRDERVAKYIDADWDNIWKILNLNFESAIIPGGNSTVDETMLPWHGWKAVTMAVRLAVSGPSNRMRDSSETQVICLWRSMVWSGRVHGIIHRDGFFDLRMKLTEDTPLYTIMLHGLHDGQFRVFSNGKMLVSAYRGDSALILATSNATTDLHKMDKAILSHLSRQLGRSSGGTKMQLAWGLMAGDRDLHPALLPDHSNGIILQNHFSSADASKYDNDQKNSPARGSIYCAVRSSALSWVQDGERNLSHKVGFCVISRIFARGIKLTIGRNCLDHCCEFPHNFAKPLQVLCQFP
ncbi:hypothetical protein PROFUN_11639 [Planoprotostelium fungivorum]|uniref:PiggyBac transposable element-derived protein domain-containing protein n=1 Tax=Planoprotostelium fungivorum TaxID=1890364 RepID=A0A2P6N9R6_9EUKA|nr:hypothetical protein PROFUN_11639 [Planoprotostelium fungivorum]